MTTVEFDGVTKVFPGGAVAVDDLSLTVDDGEFLILVGPSGCGKSTALRMVAGLEKISAGSITVGGTRVNDIPPKDRDIAMVFQNYALYPHMTVEKNLGFALRQRKASKDEIAQRVGDMAAMLGLTDLLQRRPGQLSGGQRQRVAMGRALVREPQVFLLDEPLSNLDAKLRVQMRAELKKLHHRLGITTIYVTHDQVEAMTLGDRIAVLSAGRLQQIGAPAGRLRPPGERVRGRVHRVAADEPAAAGPCATDRCRRATSRSRGRACPTPTSSWGSAQRDFARSGQTTPAPASSCTSTWWSRSATR